MRISMPLVSQASQAFAQSCGGPTHLIPFLKGIDCSLHLGALQAQEITLETLITDSGPDSEDQLTSEALCAATKIPIGACRRILGAARKLGKRRAARN